MVALTHNVYKHVSFVNKNNRLKNNFKEKYSHSHTRFRLSQFSRTSLWLLRSDFFKKIFFSQPFHIFCHIVDKMTFFSLSGNRPMSPLLVNYKQKHPFKGLTAKLCYSFKKFPSLGLRIEFFWEKSRMCLMNTVWIRYGALRHRQPERQGYLSKHCPPPPPPPCI